MKSPATLLAHGRINRIKALGGNPFHDFQIPRAILTLRQGVGRLMRSADDRGVIAILDTRLFAGAMAVNFSRVCPLAR